MSKKKKLDGRTIIFNVINYSIFGIFTLICIFPIYYIFINTISDNDLVTKGLILFWPKGVHLGNYAEIFKISGLGRAALISVIRTIVGTALTVLCSAFLGYAFSRREMWHRKFWYRFVVVTMYFNAGIIPTYINYKNLHLLNTFWVYVIPGMVSAFYLILFKTFVESIPASLEESAELDGAGYLTIFTKIIMPLSKPIIATISVFAAVNQWNSFMDTLLYVTDQKLFTLQYLLQQYLKQVTALANVLSSAMSVGVDIDPSKMLSASSVRMTIAMVVIIPILFVYPFFQRYFVKGLMVGAVKG